MNRRSSTDQRHPMQPAAVTGRDRVRALGAGLGLLILLAGVPLLLLLTIGNPIPGWQDLLQGDVTDAAVIAVLASIAWIAWAQFALAAGVETVSLLMRAPMPRRIPGVMAGQQQLARGMVTALLVLIPALSPLAGAMAATHASAATQTSAASVSASPAVSVSASPSVSLSPGAVTGSAVTGGDALDQVQHQVQQDQQATTDRTYTIGHHGPGTYWDLAQEYLGDGARWHEIWDLNRGRTQADGAHLTSAGLLRPGWTVLLPAASTDNANSTGSQAGRVTVHRGDTLSEIAHEQGTSWQKLFKRNEGRTQPGGGELTNPDHIEPGWTIDVGGTLIDQQGKDAGAARGGAIAQPVLPSQTALPTALPTAIPTALPTAIPTALPTAIPTALPTARPTAAPTSAVQPTTAVELTAAQPDVTASTHTQPSSSLNRLGLGTGAGLLAAAALVALMRYRRRQFRHRLPGQTIDTIPPELAVMEKTLLTQGGAALPDVVWLDEVLRDLARRVTASGHRLPDVTAVRLDDEVAELVIGAPGQLSEPDAEPPAPWHEHPVNGRWQVYRRDYEVDPGTGNRHLFAPFPTLVSVGYSDAGDYWLLDLERAGSLSLVGDRTACLDLARFIAAELSHNLWSEQLQVTLVGFGAEIENVNPERVTYTTDGPQALARLSAQLRSNLTVLQNTGLDDALHGRERDLAADQWMPHVLLIDPAAAETGRNLDDLLQAMKHRGGRSAAAIVISDDGFGLPNTPTDWQLVVTADGFVIIPALGLRLHAQQLPVHEAFQLAQLLSAATHLGGRDIPAAYGDQTWDALSDAAGALIPSLTVARPDDEPPAGHSIRLAPPMAESAPGFVPGSVPEPARPASGYWDPSAPSIPVPFPRPVALPGPIPVAPPAAGGSPGAPPAVAPPDPAQVKPAANEPAAEPPDNPSAEPSDNPSAEPATNASTVLPRTVASMLATTATTGRDIEALAPGVTDRVRRQVEEADAGLDEDLANWHCEMCDRPRLSLLGPLQVRTAGSLPADRPRVAWHTEVVAYLAAHPRGVTAEQLGTDLWPLDPDIASKSKLRQAVYLVRRWLGEDPETGQPFLPAAAAGASGGASLYRLDGLLTDADLFRRLRLRGVARGADGIADLESALDLVTGPPFDQRRPGGYAWLVDTPLDHEYTGMIVDVAHLVATHHLAEGLPGQAAAAAQISLTAGSRDDIALLDLVAAADAQGNRGEAAAWIQQILTNHDADVEEDLPPRTAEVLHRRRWMEAAS